MAERARVNTVYIGKPLIGGFDFSTDLLLIVNTKGVGQTVQYEEVRNFKSDVELVQFCLAEVIPSLPILIPVNLRRAKNGELISIDGIYGENTRSIINFYQTKVMNLNRGVGVVSAPSLSSIQEFDSEVKTIKNLLPQSYSQAKTILHLAYTWSLLNPGKDIRQSPKIGKARSLLAELGPLASSKN